MFKIVKDRYEWITNTKKVSENNDFKVKTKKLKYIFPNI